jgi:adsorption protein B
MTNLIVLEILFHNFPGNQMLQYTLLDTDAYRTILGLNLFFLLNRMAQRIFFTTRIYGLTRGLMAGPRMVVSNFLNFYATLRATYIFVQHKLTGRPIVWDKTLHTYPI